MEKYEVEPQPKPQTFSKWSEEDLTSGSTSLLLLGGGISALLEEYSK